MGSYLLVTQKSDIPKAVGTIVEGYKKILTLKTVDPKLIRQAIIATPSAMKVDIPAFKVPQTSEETQNPVVKKEIPPTPKPKEKIAVEVPRQREIDLTGQTVNTLPKDYFTALQTHGGFIPVKTTLLPPVLKKAIVPVFKQPVEKELATTSTIVTTVPVSKTPVNKTPARPKPTETAPTKEAKYTSQREEAKETTLEIYFTDGKGKFYETTPQIVLRDPKTNEQVQKFYRTVNATGNPDPQNIPVGTYNLTVTGKSNLLVRNIEVRPNSKNKYMIQVNKASLRFEYEDDPNQPVAEYSARVKKNFEAGPVNVQLCTQEVEYEPGNYHIAINTLPIDHRSVDLEFGAEIVIKIEKPGYVQFTNTNNLGQVTLYYQLGDQYVSFYKLDINGNQEKQKLRLQRGNYRVAYRKFANAGSASQEMKDFNVKTNLTTEIELN